MSASSSAPGASREFEVRPFSGFVAVTMLLILLLGSITLLAAGGAKEPEPRVPWILGGVAGLVVFVFLPWGLFAQTPNQSRVMTLFGRYSGTVKATGFFYVNPFTFKRIVSLRARTMNGEKLKVNDRSGNPIEIAAVVVWQVKDTYAACFEVDDYVHYVTTQSESAVRKLASAYHYDGEEHEMTLRGATEEVNEHLARELHDRLTRAGVEVLEARITHLAYAPEIAHAMLQRQQAAAVVAARTKIVEGAVGMVEMALAELATKGVVDLDAERRAAMVSNLMVVLCSERTTPVVNAGSLYH